MDTVINKLILITIAYGLWVIYLLYMTLKIVYIRHNDIYYLLAYLGALILGRFIEVAITLVFWKMYSIKYREEKVFESIYKKVIAVGILLLALKGFIQYQFGQLFPLVTLILAMRKLKQEAKENIDNETIVVE